MVFLGGEAKVGKSALIREVASTTTDARVMWGNCEPLPIPRPLGPVWDFAEEAGSEVTHLLRTSAPRGQLFQAILRSLRSGIAPTLMVLKDVHWADEATFDLIRILGRRLSHGR